MASLAGSGTVDLLYGASLVVTGAQDSTFDGALTYDGRLTKAGAGTLTLRGANPYTGGTTVSGGTLRVIGSVKGDLGVATGATLDNATTSGLTFGNATLQGTVRTASLTRFNGLVSGAGGFGAGKVQFDGGYSPGDSPASVSFGGDLAFGARNDLTKELGDTGYDHLDVLGGVSFGGNLRIATLNGFSAMLGQSFDLFDFESSNGLFASVTFPILDKDLAWDTSLLYTSGVISVQAIPEPASFVALGLGALAFLRRRKR